MNILIMDDSATSRMLFKMHLPKDPPHTLHESRDGASALAKAQEIQPDLIVLDYNMPDMTGVAVGEALRRQGVAAPLVLLTANTQDSVLEEARLTGFFRVIEKPVNTAKLQALFEDLSK